MRIPKGTDIRVDTANEVVELHITAAITTKAQANELAAAIKQFSSLLEGEKRQRKPKAAAVAA
ncbi:hypothetical protein [Bradyrhizobium valentinum]|uniref:Uncharacterized protein n=1 Tax=Bradyrhizobium valentinum TaxID=1518501 RepID=A0A0R3KUR8_9BRAD|nr:hypothetical protein [Bradyrhizobium valentinum]KRQ99241.1 hypothetical protein CP49_11625 [Bradyrhizobium valentinum]